MVAGAGIITYNEATAIYGIEQISAGHTGVYERIFLCFFAL